MTAVEWIKSELTEVERNLINKTFLQLNKTLAGHRLKDIFEQAKEMEKQQIIDAYGVGYLTDFKLNSDYTTQTPEQYYNETFKSE